MIQLNFLACSWTTTPRTVYPIRVLGITPLRTIAIEDRNAAALRGFLLGGRTWRETSLEENLGKKQLRLKANSVDTRNSSTHHIIDALHLLQFFTLTPIPAIKTVRPTLWDKDNLRAQRDRAHHSDMDTLGIRAQGTNTFERLSKWGGRLQARPSTNT